MPLMPSLPKFLTPAGKPGSLDAAPDIGNSLYPQMLVQPVAALVQLPPLPLPPHLPPAPGLAFRSMDGSGNNIAHPTWDAAGSDFRRIGKANFADGFDSLVDGPNARTISNVVVGHGDANVDNSLGLSAMMYAWGQFIDHDLNRTNSDGKTHIDITIPSNDPNYAPGNKIAMTRAVIDPTTGVAGKPALAVNAVTSWLDASMVYGSNATTAASLRGAGGHLLTSAGNNLPILNGAFVAGDDRAQETPSLTALQTLFLREHNYQVDQLAKQHPDWNSDQLYNQARAIVTAEIAHITYSEFLTKLLGTHAIAAYHGYNPSVDPRMTEEFAGAAFRFGHSIVSDNVVKLDNNGKIVGPQQSLKDVFFATTADYEANTGTDGILRHLGSDVSQELDVKIVDSLRNFLFAPPAFLDLAAINIQRGRDLGLGTLNDTRAALGFARYSNFSQITSDTQVAADLKTVYGTVDKVELWVGGLAETHAAGAFIGQTFQAIIAQQFTALRDGDRFYYENQGFAPQTLNQINTTSLADIVMRNTDTAFVQNDMFTFYERHTTAVTPEHPSLPQLIMGTTGTDTLTGGTAGDILVAAAGNMTMTGGNGADLFVFDVKGVTATITDFVPGSDKIEMKAVGLMGPADLRLRMDHNNTVLTGGGESITLLGIAPQRLSAADFIFKS